MVAVHVEIAAGLEGEVHEAVPGQRGEHVIEEADARLHAGIATSVEVDPNSEIGLVGLPGDFGSSCHLIRVRGKR
jgi:hypothetical protein